MISVLPDWQIYAAKSPPVVINPYGDLGACGEDQPRYLNASEVFFSPNFGEGQHYPPNQDCTWLIEYSGDEEGVVSWDAWVLGGKTFSSS